MEKRLNKKFEQYIAGFKESVRDKMIAINFEETTKCNELIEYVYDYERLIFEKDDVCKRKRIKNNVPMLNRCNAKRANGEQCTRRRKDTSEFCGTHDKGTPHGLVCEHEIANNLTHNIVVIAKEIGGIVYYIDDRNNVYNTEDVMLGKQNPRVIAQYVNYLGVYTIPELGI